MALYTIKLKRLYKSLGRNIGTNRNILVINYVRADQREFSSGKAPILITPMDEAKRFMNDCLVAVGTPCDNAEIVAENLITADHRGHYSHGMIRLESYLRDIQNCLTDASACPEILKETKAVVLLDGKNGLGAVIGKHCMDLAIKKAKEFGIGFVAARGCNHYGMAGMYALQAIEKGLVGFSVTNTPPLMAPTRAKEVALGTNPISVGAPGLDGDNFVLDMATTAVALGKIEVYKKKGQKIPKGWALNDKGEPEADSAVAYKAAKLMPLGGPEVNSGYKGYGLGIAVEVFSGILTGSAFGPFVRRYDSTESKPYNLGSAFMALDPKVFEPQFETRLQKLMCYLRKMEPVDPKKPVQVHGDYERDYMKKAEKDGGLRYEPEQHKTMKKLSEEFKVDLPCSKPLKEC